MSQAANNSGIRAEAQNKYTRDTSKDDARNGHAPLGLDARLYTRVRTVYRIVGGLKYQQ
jgi:hypothetical protein